MTDYSQTRAFKDDGYTKICNMCGCRHAMENKLIGRERFLKVEDCEGCRDKPRYRNIYDFALVTKADKCLN